MTWDEVKTLTRDFRKNRTKEEDLVWRNLRNRKLLGIKFLRQHPIEYHQHGKRSFFIVDFYSHESALVIEIDGGIHNYQQQEDVQRDDILRSKGLTVIRFTNKEINSSMVAVMNNIKQQLIKT